MTARHGDIRLRYGATGSAVATTNGKLIAFPKGPLRQSEIALQKFGHAKFYLCTVRDAV